MAAAADDASPTDDAAEHEEPAAPQPPSWQIASDPPAAADDAKVNRLLNALNPLRAQQFVASPPTPAIPTRHRLAMVAEIDGQQTEHVVQIEEPEDDAEPPVARYNGLVFEVSRSLLDHVRADFRASAEPAETEPPGSVPVEAAPHVSDGFTPQTAPEPAEFTPMPETP
jgi:hypothetical protein